MDLLALRTRTSIPIFVATGAALLALAAVSPGRAQQSAQPQYTIRQRVPLTYVDVVVTDDKGHPVHGLHQSDFTLLEDGQPMTPNSFDEHRSDQAAPATTLATPTLPPNTFTNDTPTPPSDRPLNVLLIDSLNTPAIVQGIVQKRLLDFVDKMPAGTRIEVLALDPRLSILQGFTGDRELLRKAITAKLPQFSTLQDPQQDPTNTDPPDLEVQASLTEVRIRTQIASMKQLARYLSGIPGRKNLLWFTASSPLTFPPQPLDPGLWPPELFYDETDAMQSAGDALARAHVAVYSVESRGLEVIPPHSRKMDLHLTEHYTMDKLADQTGGHAYYNTNGLAESAADALDSGSNYYTLTYTPTNQALDTRFRTITVKVSQPNLHLTYRNGYYAVDPAVDARGKPIEKVTPMQTALMRGALDSTQILFNVKVAQAPGTEATLPATNIPDAKQMHPPYRRYSIAYTIDAHNLEFAPSPDGNYRANFEYGVNVYSPGGDQILNSASKIINPVLPPVVYHSMLKSGAGAHLDIDVPATGEFFLRIAVHDLASDRTGSIEVPTASLTSVSPATSAAPSSTPPLNPNPPNLQRQ